MKKINLIALLLALSTSIANAGDCIMVKELNVKFTNDTTTFVDPMLENERIVEFKNFINETNLFVLVEGHTNNKAAAAHNLTLSTSRAVKVMKELVASGLKKSHVRAMGFGESSPIYSNNNANGLAKNRRVIAEVFNSAKELDDYIQESKARIINIKLQEQ